MAGPLTAGLFASLVGLGLVGAAALPAAAQSAGPFGGFKHDSSAPIEITSDALEVRQAEQLAIFTGDVVAGQGTLRLTADRVEVTYADQGQDSGTGAIRELVAEGNVFISNGAETAQGQKARYDIESGIITMTGDVVLTQGQNVISGQQLTIDLDEGQGRVESGAGGRVKSIFTPQDAGSE
ncbi:MAG TPA: lipopolysaccharide transport periplasmic protein LptA [Paracoccaceae bacterium]|nr:lipopolysaccharide transport periplasmic protein LptA [Paracoccaceae bacterium]